MQHVLSTEEARTQLPGIAKEFANGHHRAVQFGPYRVPQAAIVPIEWAELIEDLLLAEHLRNRIATDNGVRYTPEQVAAEIGIDYSELVSNTHELNKIAAQISQASENQSPET